MGKMTMGEQIVELRTELKAHCKNGKETDDMILSMLDKIDSRFDSLDNRFANKWVEKTLPWLIGLVFTFVATVIVVLI